MISIVVFLTVIAIIAAWWLSQQRLTAKPWLETGVIGEMPDGEEPWPAAKIGLGVFLAVVGSLFALFVAAYSMRMQGVDWRPLPVPRLLWLNTGVLVMSCAALQWAVAAARRGEMAEVKLGVLAAAVSAFLFLVGQFAAWRELSAAGYFLASNPANSFFYVITGLHGLHLLGGLVALGRTGARVWRGGQADQVRLGVELCATYWHFLLFIWLILLAVLTGWANDFAVICRQLLT